MLKTLLGPYGIRLFDVVTFPKTLLVSRGVMWIDLLLDHFYDVCKLWILFDLFGNAFDSGVYCGMILTADGISNGLKTLVRQVSGKIHDKLPCKSDVGTSLL